MKVKFSILNAIYLCGTVSLVFVLALSGIAHSDTIIDSNIITNTPWKIAGSPYLIIKSIDVYPGVTLSIEPGVEIRFNLNCDLEIFGKLIASGTAVDPIVFTSNSGTPLKSDWNGIIFKDGSIGTIEDEKGNYVGGSIMNYCEVKYAKNVIIDSTDLYMHFTNNLIDELISVIIYFP